MSYVVEIKEQEDLYGIIGPFTSRDAATEWGMQHVEMDPDLSWEVLPLHDPEEGLNAI